MSQQLYFSRDTKVYIAIGVNIWEIPVLDGFSFAQSTNKSEIVLAEMESTAGVSRRGKRVFNDSLAPVEWGFTTYIRPFISNGADSNPPLGKADTASRTHAVEEVLWALMSGPAAYAGSTFTNQVTHNSAGTEAVFDWSESNKSTLGTCDIYFVTGDANKKTYKCTSAVVNEATIDFDIDGIASISWSGMASSLDPVAEPTATIYEAISETGNFIRNRLTTLSIVPNNPSQDGLQASYDLTLTGGSITISNNISYITPEEIGFVNFPIGHVTGGRSVSGTFTAYVLYDTITADKSFDLWEDMIAATTVVTHSIALTFNIGGGTATPRLEVNMPQAHIDIPTHNIEDVIAVEIAFDALPSTIDLTDEFDLTYVGVAY